MMSGIGGMSGMGRMPSMEQMSRMREKAFSKADGDASGGLDKAEFGKLMEQGPMGQMGKMGGASGIDTSKAFDKMDADGNGLLTQGELETGMKATMEKFSSVGGMAGMGGMGGAQKASGAGGGEDFDPVASLMKALENAIGNQKAADESASTEGSGSKRSADTSATSAQQMLDKLISRLTQAYDSGGDTQRLSLQA